MSKVIRADLYTKTPNPIWRKEAHDTVAEIIESDQPDHLKALDIVDVIAHYAREVGADLDLDYY